AGPQPRDAAGGAGEEQPGRPQGAMGADSRPRQPGAADHRGPPRGGSGRAGARLRPDRAARLGGGGLSRPARRGAGPRAADDDLVRGP
ncbi:hypothetical protein DF186_18255, partial [Enterococcus hirae]